MIDDESVSQQAQTQTQSQTTDRDPEYWLDSQPQQQEKRTKWGRIVPKRLVTRRLGSHGLQIQESSATFFDIYDETFTIGRNPNGNWVITRPDVPARIFDRISTNHCRITKDCSVAGNPVYIQDLSRNGTFINGELIGANEKRILKSDDVISFNDPKFKFFEFINCCQETFGIPDDIFEVYHMDKHLGSGAQGTVRMVIDRITCEPFAMKVVQIHNNSIVAASSGDLSNDRIMREISIMKNLVHPNIIRFEGVIVRQRYIYMFLDFMEGGDLLHRINRQRVIPLESSRHLFRQLCHAVKYLHDQNITHRDIKPENILLQSNEEMTVLKLSDFGLSKLLQEQSELRTVCGTKQYAAPEIVLAVGRATYTCKVDIWSLGIVLYAMLCGTLPFPDKDSKVAISNQFRIDYNSRTLQHVPKMVKELIKSMLTVNPNKRASIDDVLSHPWLQLEDEQNNVDDMIVEVIRKDGLIQPAPKRRRVD